MIKIKNYSKLWLIPLLLIMIMSGCEDRPGINSPLIVASEVTLSSNPSAGGTTSGGGTFFTGSSVTVTATANAGYTFTNWTENGKVVTSSLSYQFTVSGNKTLVANFTAVAPTQNTVTLSSNPLAGGTTSGSGAFNSGSSVTITATANAGYIFTNWTENGNVVTSSLSYQFTINGNKTFVANFTAVASTQNTVTLSSNPSAGGTTSGGGAFNSGSSVTLTATPATGYTFINWTENGIAISTNASYTFTISRNRTLVANFTINTHTLTITSVNGTVTKNPNQTNYNYGSIVTLTANPNTGYTFTGWSGDATGSTNPLTVTMNGNKNITANFAINTYTLTITSVNGTVTKNPNQTNYNHGSNVTLTATPSIGYTFTSWSGDATGSTNPLTITMDGNKNITANFTAVTPTQYIVILTSNPLAGGNTNGNGTFNSGTSVTVTATPNAEYTFTNWTENGTTVSTNASYTFTLSGNRTLVANFTAVPPPPVNHLGSASTFGIMATAAVTSTGFSVINGDVSLDPGTSMTGFPPGVVNGTIHINDAASALARADLLIAYNYYKNLPPGTTISGGADLGALYPLGIPPGTYTSGSTMLISTPLVLDAGGDVNAVWVFQIGSSFTTGASVTLINGAQANNVFWVPTLDATIGVGTIFYGTIVSGRDVTAVTGATIYGRILAGATLAGTIALQTSTVNVP